MAQQQHHEIEHSSPDDVVVLDASDGANNGANIVDEKDFKNMRLAIGTLDKTIFQISLGGDNLTDTKHIDIRLKRNNRGQQGPAKEAAKGSDEELPEQDAAPPQGRLKITVAAEGDKDENEYINEMRGWLLTVTTLFVNMAFDAMLHPPEWMKTEWYEQGLTRHGPRWHHAAIISNPNSHAAAAVAPSPPQPATASASEVSRAYLYLSFNSLTFAMALALVLLLLSQRPKYLYTLNANIVMLGGISWSLALTFALGTSNNWKVMGIACLALLVCFYGAVNYVIGDALIREKGRKMRSKSKTETKPKQLEKKMMRQYQLPSAEAEREGRV